MAEQDKPDNAEAHAKADADGSTMDRIKTGAFERNVALTRMGVGAGAKIAGHTVRNFFRRGESKDEANRNFYRAQAKELADELVDKLAYDFTSSGLRNAQRLRGAAWKRKL